MKVKFDKTPKCEVCGKEKAISFSCMTKTASEITDWKFCGMCTAESEKYYIKIDNFFSSPGATVDWLAHMHEKNGMDWKNFMAMIIRFREATGSFFKL
jgi:transcription elongation factor Elf1